MGEPTALQLMQALLRVEEKLDALLCALAEEEGDLFTLDGELAGGERPEGMPL